MKIIIWIIISLIAGTAVFFLLPFSPAKAQFHKAAGKAEIAPDVPELFTEEDIANLPAPVQRYFRHCGYVGAPKMAYLRASLRDVAFVMSESKTINIDYQQYNCTERPERFALISSRLGSIPFEGLDSYQDGRGSMKGVLAKVIPLFDRRGQAMDRACLVAWLAECLLAPNAALQDFVAWEQLDETHARAGISWQGVDAGGVFCFADSGELLEFRTGDRVAVDMRGRETVAEWSAYFSDYHAVNGILQPGVIQSAWHYAEGDCLYFNSNRSPIVIAYGP